MTDISRRLEQTLRSAIQKNPILPVKVEEGILVGDILIVSDSTVKHLKRNNNYLYKDIYLNAAAICMANLLAMHKSSISIDAIYRADQEYGRWYTDSQLLRAQYQRSINSQDHDRADTQWARYCESRDKAINAKNIVQRLAAI